MKQIVCAILDRKAKSFGAPMLFANADVAVRMATTLLSQNGGQSDLEKYPADFDLYWIGEYDSGLGVIAGIETPQFMFTFGNLVATREQV